MAITKSLKPAPTPSPAMEAFIAGAPDASAPVRRGVVKGKKQQISLTIRPELLDQVDAMAERLGQSRAAIISLAVQRAVEHGLMLDGAKG